MAEIDAKCKDQDGFLYGAYTSQEVFGSPMWPVKLLEIVYCRILLTRNERFK
jgi:hypothetical protein